MTGMSRIVRVFFFFSSRRRHTRCSRDWSSDVCSSDLVKSFCGSQRRRIPSNKAFGASWASSKSGAAGKKKPRRRDRKSTRLNSSHGYISYAVFCLKKKKNTKQQNGTCPHSAATNVPVQTP